MASDTKYAISVMCPDRVGLVACLTSAVSKAGGNIEELHQGVVQGYFAFTMLANFPSGESAEVVKTALEKAGKSGDFVVSVLPRASKPLPPAALGGVFVLTLSGNDSPSILSKLTGYLADRGINIDDLSSRVDNNRFLITAQLTIPDEVDIKGVRLDLAEVLAGGTEGVSLMHQDIFAATNQVSMRPSHGKRQ